jgi:N-acetylglutamate synthase-like GNAT family acetyltransferase
VIRVATESDVPRLAEMGLQFLSASPYSQRLDGIKAVDVEPRIKAIMDLGRVFVYEVEDRIYGCLCAIISHPWFADKVTAAVELAWWVNPDMRGSPAAARLMAAFEAWAKEEQVDFVVLSDMRNHDDEWPAAQLVDRLGYKACERTHVKEIQYASIH